MYITSFEELARAIDERRQMMELITERHHSFMLKRYGIDLERRPPPKIPDFGNRGKPLAVLARQIASVCMEDVAFEIVAREGGCVPLTLTFVRDAFTASNHDKLHRIDVPWMRWDKSGKKLLAYERLTSTSNKELEATPLSMIQCASGKNLPGHHRELRKAAMLSGMTYDISHWHAFMLENARKRPEYVFRVTDGREERISLTEGAPIERTDRPPSTWYYPYYLSWFLTGSMVLFETYDNPIGDVSVAKELFEKCMWHIHSETGFFPLIVKIPALSMDMLQCNRHLLWRNDALDILGEQAKRIDTRDTVSFFEKVAESVIQFR